MFGEVVAIVKDIVLTLAAIVAGYVGIRGLGTWRRQLRGNAEYQLAKSMLTSVYELREAMSGIRNPFMQYSKELDLPEDKLKELSQREGTWHALAQAYQRRWESVPRAMAKLDANLLEAEVVWGPGIREKASPLNRLTGELLFALQDHLEAQNPDGRYESPGPELIKNRHETLYDVGEKDGFKERLQEVIRQIENELRPHIVQHHR